MTSPAFSDATTRALSYLLTVCKQSEAEEMDDALTEAAGDWVDCEMSAEDCRAVYQDLGRRHSAGIDHAVLHKWGSRDLSDDLDLFASSLACELLKAEVYRQMRGK